jgi:membrane-bound metal-dependent hydrolase YbcI (DUF457 family)
VRPVIGRTHATSGAVAVLAVVPLLRQHGVAVDGWAVPVAAVVGAGSAMLPDLDHPSGTIARSLGPVTTVLATVVGFCLGGHRSGTHSLLGLAMFTGLGVLATNAGGLALGLYLAFLFAIASAAVHVSLVKVPVLHTAACLLVGAALTRGALFDSFSPDVIPWAVGIGTAVHLLGDMATVQGCPLFWPFWRHRFNYAALSTNHFTERFVVGPALTFIAIYLAVAEVGGVEMLGPAWKAAVEVVRSVVPA